MSNFGLYAPVFVVLNTADYTYLLPPERIALYPLVQRDASRLLFYNKGKILHSVFGNIPEYLPADAFLFLNNTKVIPARLHFRKESGAAIEIFLLNPVHPSSLLSEAMAATGECSWQCTIGNAKKWNDGLVLKRQVNGATLSANLADRKEGIVRFTWDEDVSFAEIIRYSGETPLPPYIKRNAEPSDAERYQTVYSHHEGAVAAPTAGLHFTPEVFDKLRARGIQWDFLTLHVSAGTFQPIKTGKWEDHIMHEEQVIVNRDNVRNLMPEGRFIIPIGTTSMRTLESLYWYGVKLLEDRDATFNVTQNDPYTGQAHPPLREALDAVGDYMDRNQLEQIVGETSIYIRPGYEFKVCKGLVTNFHQPGSTLILLVAAFVGEDWRRIYDEALKNDYRFLSYGDSSLLIP